SGAWRRASASTPRSCWARAERRRLPSKAASWRHQHARGRPGTREGGTTPMRMKAAILFEQGRKRPYAETKPLVVEEVELEGPGPGEILIEVAAAGLCHSDLSAIEGIRPRPLPIVIGHEGAGIVREVGPGVTGLKPGDHVI